MNVLEVAGYFDSRYRTEKGLRIDEMKLHKLLYLAQRESLVRSGQPLFHEEICAWQFGPVVPIVRAAYRNDDIPDCEGIGLSNDLKELLDYVYVRYAGKSAWSLSRLTHSESSWRAARARRNSGGGHRLMLIQDIMEDGNRIAKRRRVLKELGLL